MPPRRRTTKPTVEAEFASTDSSGSDAGSAVDAGSVTTAGTAENADRALNERLNRILAQGGDIFEQSAAILEHNWAAGTDNRQVLSRYEDLLSKYTELVKEACLAIRGMDQGQALAGLRTKLVGPQVHTYTRIKYDSCKVLFEDLLTLLCPETARNELFTEIVTKCRYLGFAPSEALQQVNVDMSFLRQGNTTHQHASASVVQALTEIFPAEITRPLAEGLLLKETTEALCKAIIKDKRSSTYNG
ncbi:hypothetical protein GGH98_001934 [Coemansia sp. RSA 454]|nr:hypothetical protein GGH98_001934 [Coemansia sp. RSA 454]